MKITYSTYKINSFGGINFANSIIGNTSVYNTIDEMPGNRGIYAQYRYSDLFRSYFLMTLCGGECAGDITEHFRGELAQVKDFDICSADTLLRMQKELATSKETIVSKTNIEHDYNINISTPTGYKNAQNLQNKPKNCYFSNKFFLLRILYK